MANIGPKLSIDGYSDYKKQIDNLIAQAGSLDAEMKAVTSAFDENTSAQEQSARKGEVLQKQLDAQQERVRLLAEIVEKATEEYGENDTAVLKWKTALSQAQAEANGLEKEIRENAEALDRDEEAAGKAAKETEDFGDEAKAAEGKAGGFADAVKAAAGGLLDIAGAALDAGKAVVSFAADSAKKGAAFADNILTMANNTGLSTQALQEYQYMAELTDVPLETITKSLAKLTSKMDDAKAGSKTAEEAFRKLGVAVTDENGQLRSNEAVFADVINALGGIENATERDAVSMDLFGKSAQDLNSLIKQGGDGIAAFRQEAHDMGYVLDDELLDSLGGMDDAFQRLELVGQSLTNQLALALAPTVTQAGDAFMGFAQEAIGAVSAASDAFATDNLDDGVQILVDFAAQAVDELIKALPELLDIGGIVMRNVGGTLLANLPALLDTGTKLITALCESFGDEESTAELTKAAVGIVSDLVRWLAQNAPQLMNAAVEIILGLADGLTDPDALTDLIDAALELILALAGGLIMAIPELIKKAPVIAKNLMDALVEEGPKLLEAGGQLLKELTEGLDPEEMLQSGVELIKNLLTGIGRMLQDLSKMADEVWDEIKAPLADMGTAALEWGGDLIDGLIKGISDFMGDVGKKAGEIWDEISEPFTGLGEKALKWGQDLMDGFKKGIEENPIVQAIGGVAQGVKDFLGFSEPEKGPLSDFHTFAPDMMELFMKGIRDSEGHLQATVAHAFDFEPLMANGAPAGTTVTHGDVHITVYGAEGQDVRELARIIKQDIIDEWDDEEADSA